MQKTPFEIRLELLQLAKQHYDAIYAAQVEFAKAAFIAALKENETKAVTWLSFVPANFTIEEITKKAEEMYAFINKR